MNSEIKFYSEGNGFFFNFRLRRKHGKIDIIKVAYRLAYTIEK